MSIHEEHKEGKRTTDERLKHILESARVIATVGFSANPGKPSHAIPRYLMEQGYRVIPVNPAVDEILGEKAYAELAGIPDKVDVVQLFRPSEAAPPFVDQAIQIGARVVWMQEGISNEAAAATARAAGLEVVMDRCMKVEHRRLIGEK